MKKGNSLVFFPGKGIFTNPDSGLSPVINITKRAEAVKLLRQFTSKLVQGGKSTSAKVARLLAVHGRIVVDGKSLYAVGDSAVLNFSDRFIISDTHVSCTVDTINWIELEKFLGDNGYRLELRNNRSYIKGLNKGDVYVYAVTHDVFGVVAEGKGFTNDQAKKSALSEAIERCFGSGKNEANIVVGSKRSLFKLKTKNCPLIAAGPRDVYDDHIYTEWVQATDIINNKKTYLPAEVAFFNYNPKKVKLKLFSLSHTTGVAAGASAEDAAMSGLFEIIERDAYWISMRCKVDCPDIDPRKVRNINPSVIFLIDQLVSAGFKIVIKDMSLDWGVPVAHVVIKDLGEGIPCFAHGSGAGCIWAVAVARAVAEAVQMYFGMKEFSNIPDHWEKVISAQGNLGSGVLSWADPLYQEHISHLLFKSRKKFKSHLKVKSPRSLLELLKRKGYSAIVAPVYKKHGLHVVRVYVPEATQPDERLERISNRLLNYKKKLKLRGFYCDPILT